MRHPRLAAACLAVLSAGLAACANIGGSAEPQITQIVPAQPSPAAAPQDLRIYFDAGQSRLKAESRATLDQAARLFRAGDPLVMIVSGQADTTGDGWRNLMLSQARASAVARGLMDRGIPATRLQLVAKGEAEPLVTTGDETSQAENRAVVITWRK